MFICGSLQARIFTKLAITAMLNVIRSMENTSSYRLYDSFFQYCAIYWHPFLEKKKKKQKHSEMDDLI